DTHAYSRTANAFGPWLVIDEYRQRGDSEVHREFRSLADGSLVSRLSVPVNGWVRHFMTVIDHPELGKDCLVGYNNAQNNITFVAFQPRTSEQKTIAEFPGGITFQFNLSQDQRRWVEQRHLPISPFLLLAHNGCAQYETA